MRRGTPAAELFGGLLAIVRTAGTGSSMRPIGDKVGAPAATVSQIEKGQRALKEPKIVLWAAALGVNAEDLHELWTLSQGQIPLVDRLVFYSDYPDLLGGEELRPVIVTTLEERPDLEPIFRLAERIAAVLRRLVPNAGVHVEPDEFEPRFVEEMNLGTITAAQEDEDADAAENFLPLPVIECYWNDAPDRQLLGEKRDRVRVPLLKENTPIVRRRGKSVKAVDLEDLVRGLSGPERERVRGYVEAILEQRTDPAS